MRYVDLNMAEPMRSLSKFRVVMQMLMRQKRISGSDWQTKKSLLVLAILYIQSRIQEIK
ncbi:hypothetical protein D3C72_2040930 [compost metagenome]